jgi:ATP-dependent DNA helicase
MGTLHMPSTPSKTGDASLATDPAKREEVSAADFADAGLSPPAAFEVKPSDAPHISPIKSEEQADGFVHGRSSVPIDLEAKNGDASLITQAMEKEEEELEAARARVEEEEEARKREEAAKLAFDPQARYSKLDELLTRTQLFSEFLLEKMDQIVHV